MTGSLLVSKLQWDEQACLFCFEWQKWQVRLNYRHPNPRIRLSVRPSVSVSVICTKYQVPVYYTSTPVPAPVYQYSIYTTAGPIWSILCTMYQYKYNVPVSTPVQLRDQWSILCTRESGSSSSMKEAAKYSLNIEVIAYFLLNETFLPNFFLLLSVNEKCWFCFDKVSPFMPLNTQNGWKVLWIKPFPWLY